MYPDLLTPHEAYICKSELEALRRRGVEPRILDGFEFLSAMVEYPFRDVIDKLYQMKADAKNRGQRARYHLVKGMANSIYGKTAQTKGKIGNIFNPVWASEVTAQSRIQILEKAAQWYEEIYEIKTDSVVGRLKPEHSMLYALGKLTPDDIGLGGRGVWSALFTDKIGAFIPKEKQYYERINLQTGITLDWLHNMIHNRGFSVDSKKHQVILQADDVKVIIQSEHIVRMAETLVKVKKLKPSDIHKTLEEIKKIAISDNKREWPEGLTVADIETRKITAGRLDDAYIDTFESSGKASDGLAIQPTPAGDKVAFHVPKSRLAYPTSSALSGTHTQDPLPQIATVVTLENKGRRVKSGHALPE